MTMRCSRRSWRWSGAWVVVFVLLSAAGWVFPGEKTGEPIFLFDLTELYQLDRRNPLEARLAWDTTHLVASVQGIVNRRGPRLFIRMIQQTDDFWLDELRSPGGWLAGRPVVRLATIEELLNRFRREIRGCVVYDERVPATSNLASTIAGIEDRICLRHDPDPASICQRAMAMRLGDAVRLIGPDGTPMFTGRGAIPGSDEASTGSAKGDAYLWAKRRYLDTGRCSREFMAYYLDGYWLKNPMAGSLENFTLTNHDYFISQRAFFFDLGMWEEERCVDEPGQPAGADVRTLRTLLKAMHQHSGGRIFHIGGFVPWAWKYTDHRGAGGRHGGVDSEWKYAQIISGYNGIMDADAIGYAGMTNASFYQHFPRQDRYPQHPRPTESSLKQAGLLREDGTVAPKLYVLFYMGDYDSAAWLNIFVPRFWKDPARGTIPCAWAFNPNLDRRAPHAMHYARVNASPNDWFISGDCGAGYLNPGMLTAPRPDPQVPDGWNAWIEHSRPYFQRYDLTITGFVIDGHSPGMGTRGLDAYLEFSPDGMAMQYGPDKLLHKGRMPVVRMKMDLDGTPEQAGDKIAKLARQPLPGFAVLRTILKSPTWHKRAMEKAQAAAPGAEIEFLDPYRFFLLYKAHLQSEARRPAPVK